MKIQTAFVLIAAIVLTTSVQAAGGGGEMLTDPGAMEGKHFHSKGKMLSFPIIRAA